MDLTNQVVAITGGASGLGAGAAHVLSEAGAQVVILDRNESLAQETAKTLGATAIACDVANEESVFAAFEKIHTELGPVRALLNAAGVDVIAKTASRKGIHTLDDFQHMLNVNLTGTFSCARVAAKQMIDAEPLDEDGERGVIINVASIAGYESPAGQVAYGASKAGVIGMTLPMARDLAKYGIRVMTIAPGAFETPLTKTVPEELWNEIIKEIPFPKRLGQPVEFGALVRDICTNKMLNGEVIRLDASLRMFNQ